MYYLIFLYISFSFSCLCIKQTTNLIITFTKNDNGGMVAAFRIASVAFIYLSTLKYVHHKIPNVLENVAMKLKSTIVYEKL